METNSKISPQHLSRNAYLYMCASRRSGRLLKTLKVPNASMIYAEGQQLSAGVTIRYTLLIVTWENQAHRQLAMDFDLL